MKTKPLVTVFIASFLSLVLLNCDEETLDSAADPQTTYMQHEGLSGEIGSAGGTITVNDPASLINGTVIEIPENALSSSVNIEIASTLSPEMCSSPSIDIAVKLAPEGLVFNLPVLITLPYAEQISETDLKVFYYNPSDTIISQQKILQVNSLDKTVEFETNHFSIYFSTENGLNFCSGKTPNETNVLEALESFTFDGTNTANHTEAENILKHLCFDVSVHYPDDNTVCGEFPSGYHLTLWVGTYGYTDRYGARYGTDDNHSFWGSNDTYFEIIKPYSLSLNGTWLATEYIDKDGRDMLNGFSFTQQQTLCNGSCVLDLTWNCKYENFQVIFNEENVTMNYYINLDYPAYNCSPCTAISPDGIWDSSDLDTRSATCSVGNDHLTLTGFVLAYGGELFNPTIIEYTEDFLHLQEGTAVLKMQRIN